MWEVGVVRRSLVRVVVAVALASGACVGGKGEGATGRFAGVYGGICRAAAAARAGDQEEAARDFDDVHAGLHDLAAAAEPDDRAVAARLLEAKQQVEVALTARSLERLVPTVAAAIEATGDTAPAACP
jgi:hypothetical protein